MDLDSIGEASDPGWADTRCALDNCGREHHCVKATVDRN